MKKSEHSYPKNINIRGKVKESTSLRERFEMAKLSNKLSNKFGNLLKEAKKLLEDNQIIEAKKIIKHVIKETKRHNLYDILKLARDYAKEAAVKERKGSNKEVAHPKIKVLKKPKTTPSSSLICDNDVIEFNVNRFIKLKLEKGITNIYICNVLFTHCKRAMITTSLKYLEYIESIDELIDNALPEDLDIDYNPHYKTNLGISPEDEFWVHCSTFQVWVENNYDSLLLHKNLAFPILKELVAYGDRKAKLMFKEEIIKRLETGYHPVIEYLESAGYTKHIEKEELFSILLNRREFEVIFKIFDGKLDEVVWHYGYDFESTLDGYDILIFNKSVVWLDLSERNLKWIHNEIGCLKKLTHLDLSYNKLTTLPKTIGNLISLVDLRADYNRLETIPSEIGQLKKLKVLFLDSNRIRTLPSSIGDLVSLNKLTLDSNYIKTLPETLGNLKKLHDLGLSNNSFGNFPSLILKIESIRSLTLDANKLSNLDEKLLLLSNMEEIHLDEKFRNKKIVKKLIENGINLSFYCL